MEVPRGVEGTSQSFLLRGQKLKQAVVLCEWRFLVAELRRLIMDIHIYIYYIYSSPHKLYLKGDYNPVPSPYGYKNYGLPGM